MQYEEPVFEDAKEPYEVVVLAAHRADAWAQSSTTEVEEYGQAHGLNVTVQDAGGYANVEDQLGQLEAAIVKGVDAIIFWSTDPTAVAPTIDRARAEGIKVVGWAQPPDTEVDLVVSGDFSIDGESMATALFDQIGGAGDVLAIWGGAGSAYAAALSEGANRALINYPDVNLNEQTIPDFDPAKVQTTVENELARNPDLKGVMTSIAVMAGGAADAIDAAGKTGEVLTTAGLIGSKENVDDVQSGRITIMVGVPSVYYARKVVADTITMLNGDAYDNETIIEGSTFTADNIGTPGALDWELRAEFLE